MAENIIEALERKDYQALTSLKIIEESDPRFSNQYYDKGHDVYITPLESATLGYGSPSSLEEQQEGIQVTVQKILKFWNNPKLSYARNFEKKCELGYDELRIHRIEKFSDSTSIDHVRCASGRRRILFVDSHDILGTKPQLARY